MTRFALRLFLVLILNSFALVADIIPPGQKVIYLAASVENLEAFDDYLFMQVASLGSEIRHASPLQSGDRLSRGYKFNQFQIVAIPKDYLKQKGDWKNIDLLNDVHLLRTTGNIDVGQSVVDEFSPIGGRQTVYAIYSLADGVIQLKKVKELILEEGQEFTSEDHRTVNYSKTLTRKGFGVSLALTILVELGVMMILRFTYLKGLEMGYLPLAGLTVVAQLATLPLLWWTISRFELQGVWITFGAESFAVVVEAILYRWLVKMSWSQAWIAAVICNGLSYGAGVWLLN